jgi:hypothetical protein
MGKINATRVILGGLLAGLIINLSEFVLNSYVIADEMTALTQRLNLPAVGTNQIAIFLQLTFVLGIIMIFMYAGLRPRFGAGAKTAVIAAVTLWLVGMFPATVDTIMGVTTANLLVVVAIWSLVEMIVAGIAGAWVYKESA